MKLFDQVEPVFVINDEMNYLLEAIDRKLNQITVTDKQKREYMISKSKVRSIHSSLSIEANSLSLSAVENISLKKQVLGRIDEVQEVKNAIEVYSHTDEYDYKDENDFLKAHRLMMKYFEDDNGGYRNRGEGIKKGDKIIYIAPDSIMVPSLMESLFQYMNDSDMNLIILSSVFHYYLVAIHPFSDGNGRMARFWVSLMLKKYNRNFEFIPVEEEIYFNQEEYYSSIEQCHVNSNANVFILFMLKVINRSLDKIINSHAFILSDTQNKICELIANNRYITQNEIVDLLGISIRTVKRNFKVLTDNNIIERVGSNKKGYWQILK